ncbi:adipolin-like [Centruroides vittatus]|uniref:adipolin-like n=1 Tax=Centruroides vittatus TaxID=120091 RepID=UPI00350FD25E
MRGVLIALLISHLLFLTREVEEKGKDIVHTQRSVFDPRWTWQSFLRHAERSDQRRRKMRRRFKSTRKPMQGPQGPPGPPGPRGPPGANITKDELMQEFKELVREIAERKVYQSFDPKGNVTGPYLPPLFDIDQAAIVPRITSAFLWRSTQDTMIPKRSFVELKNFHRPFAVGGFERGEGSNAKHGRFTAPINGLYGFTVNLHVQHKVIADSSKLIHPQDGITALVCIESLCQKNVALESSASLDCGRHQFSILVTGVLFLEEGQYVSIYVDNNSQFMLKVLANSQVSGLLVGV